MRYVLGVIGVVVLAFFAIILVTNSSSSNGGNKAAKVPTTLNLLDHDNATSAVSYTVQGPLKGEDQYQSLRITVTQNRRTIDLLSGYEGNVIKTESLPNTPAAYTNFLHALINANFVLYHKNVSSDERGVCALGNRYIYDTTEGSNDLRRLWSTSCSTSQGSFAGTPDLVGQLFENQITDYNNFIVGSHISF